jgi:hypothetical protein
MSDTPEPIPTATDPVPAPAGEPQGDSDDEVTITETTVGLLDDRRVAAGNIWTSDYSLPDGTGATGMTAQLFVLGEGGSGVIVGPGGELDIGGARWVVTAVEKPDERRHGWVVLRRRHDPDDRAPTDPRPMPGG